MPHFKYTLSGVICQAFFQLFAKFLKLSSAHVDNSPNQHIHYSKADQTSQAKSQNFIGKKI